MNGEIVMANSRFDVLVYLFFGAVWLVTQILNARAQKRKREAAMAARTQRAPRTIRSGPAEPPPARPAADSESPQENLRRFLRELADGMNPGDPAGGFKIEPPVEAPPVEAPQPAAERPAPPPFIPVARPTRRRVAPRPPAPAPVLVAAPVTAEVQPPPAIATPEPAVSFSDLPAVPRLFIPPPLALSTGPRGTGRPARRRRIPARAALREAFVWKTILDSPLALRPPGGGF